MDALAQERQGDASGANADFEQMITGSYWPHAHQSRGDALRHLGGVATCIIVTVGDGVERNGARHGAILH